MLRVSLKATPISVSVTLIAPPLGNTLSGQDPPKFSIVPGGEYRQEAGRELVIPCAAEREFPYPNITWRKVSEANLPPSKGLMLWPGLPVFTL